MEQTGESPRENELSTKLADLKLSYQEILNSSFVGSLEDVIAAADNEPVPAEPSSNISPEEQEKKRFKRFMVISEIYETEKGYLNDFNNLVRNFFDPLNSAYLASVATVASKTETTNAASIVQNTTFGNENQGWLTFDQKQSIIRNASNLLRVQKLFTKLLEEAVRTPFGETTPTPEPNPPVVNNPSVSQIARCFITMMAKLESVYVPFCSMHDTALVTISAIKRAHPNQINNFIEESRQRMNTKFEIQDFLIKPVQRICKYPLLLKELLKATPQGPDYDELNEALEKIKILVGNINERKKVVEYEHKRDVILSRIHSGPQVTLYHLGKAFSVEIDPEQKTLPNNQSAIDLNNKIGKLLKGGGIYYIDHGFHELPFASSNPTSPGLDPEIEYNGLFMFADILMFLWPKKASSYTLRQIIPLKDIVTVQELSKESIKNTTVGRAMMKYSWKIIWEINGLMPNPNGFAIKTASGSYFRTVDIGFKNEKEKQSWLEDLQKVLPKKLSYLLDDQIISDSGETKDSYDHNSLNNNLASNGENDDDNPSNYASIDYKFVEVYTSEMGVKLPNTSSAFLPSNTSSKFSKVGNSASNAASNANNALKGLFRKGSTSKSSVHESKDDSHSMNQRRPSVKKKSRPVTLFGSSFAVQGDQEETSNQNGSDKEISDTATIDSTAGKRTSINDLTKWISGKGRSNSISEDKKITGSKMSLATTSDMNDDEEKKRGIGLKGKILSVGYFASRRKSGVSNESLNTVNLEASEEKETKKSIFSQLTRSFSRSHNKKQDREARISSDSIARHSPTSSRARNPSFGVLPTSNDPPSSKPEVENIKISTDSTNNTNLEKKESISGELSPQPPSGLAPAPPPKTAANGANLSRRSGIRIKSRNPSVGSESSADTAVSSDFRQRQRSMRTSLVEENTEENFDKEILPQPPEASQPRTPNLRGPGGRIKRASMSSNGRRVSQNEEASSNDNTQFSENSS